MKLIDEKGKVLGIINVIDLIILLVIVLVGAGAAYKYTHKEAQGEIKTVEFQVMVPCVRPELAQAVKAGDKMVQGGSYTTVTVKSVDIKPGLSVNLNAQGNKVISYDPYMKDVFVVNEGKVNISSASITMGGQEIRIGKDYYVKSRDYELKGTIMKIEVKD
ncbi:hypothetical protein DCCM_4499 [Desulfocucumis palustris]|uniref:DUF4330 domain-containing protein n=1 Tax=Desulfocucumis palustris TaxID=1898651 RepID=A0A2L2XM31_9FIRM|nr:DUF4330 domain-containing protein [Desulfocucumis palustris]GBF35376.1 hypothetical protein DCCM_4499 [Desulfocucumis palustris]